MPVHALDKHWLTIHKELSLLHMNGTETYSDGCLLSLSFLIE